MISIIVPVYKSEETLARCVDSLLAQTEPDVEILLVDDGSPDQSLAVCEQYAEKDQRVRVIVKANGGVSSARNAGLTQAKGEYVLFVDSDDYVHPDLCRRLLQTMEYEKADMVICGFHHLYMGRDVEKVPDSIQGAPLLGKDFLKLYGGGFLNMPWNKLIKREAAGVFDESISLGEDLLFNLDYLERNPHAAIVAEPLYYYIQDQTGATLSSKKRADKLSLALMVYHRAKEFYAGLTGLTDDVKGVIARRFLAECLDDLEQLPFDREMKKEEKLTFIKAYMEQEEIQEAGKQVHFAQLDYRLIHRYLQKKRPHMVYGLCVLRSLAVRMRRKKHDRE